MDSSGCSGGIAGLNAFLAKGKETLLAALSSSSSSSTPSPLPRCFHLVMGNRASDLDSMVSSLLHAFFRSLYPLPSCKEEGPHVYLPVFNIPREELAFRTESVWLFRQAGLELPSVLFVDEVDLSSLLSSFEKAGIKVRFVMTDHNKLEKGQTQFADVVEEIVDHHEDEGLYGPSVQRRVIAKVGSACTLVAEELLQEEGAAETLLDDVLAKLLAGTIALDTVDFNPNAGRCTDRDIQVFSSLKQRFSSSSSSSSLPAFDALAQHLQKAKFDVSSLTSNQLLRKDYKEWDFELAPSLSHLLPSSTTKKKLVVGISSFGQSVEQWFKRAEEQQEDVIVELAKYYRHRALHLLLVMTSFFLEEEEDFCRELVIYCEGQEMKELFKHVKTALCDEGELLDLEENDKWKEKLSSSSSDVFISVFTQGNVKTSRKVLQPFLADHFCV
ncbi:Exopolyphosphatase [Balamuthia mandrillaris]